MTVRDSDGASEAVQSMEDQIPWADLLITVLGSREGVTVVTAIRAQGNRAVLGADSRTNANVKSHYHYQADMRTSGTMTGFLARPRGLLP